MARILAAIPASVCVAWYCAVYSVTRPNLEFAVDRPCWQTATPPDWPPAPDLVDEEFGPGYVKRCAWAWNVAGDAPQFQEHVVSSGWPFPCLKATLQVNDTSAEWRGALVLATHNQQIPRCLPFIPIWSGLVLDAGLLIAALESGRLLTQWILRQRRTGHGRCVRCNYPITATGVCPECGSKSIRCTGAL